MEKILTKELLRLQTNNFQAINYELLFFHFMKILAIETSCDETASAVSEGRRVLSSVVHSQILMHEKWGGVVPSIAKRAHEERIDSIVDKALKNAKITFKNLDAIAVTYGPGLAIALEVGIKKAKEISQKYSLPIVPVNHMEGHLYSSFVQNSKGNPNIEFEFPYLALLVSGAHTEIILWKDHLNYQILGETVDDAAGEALDKGARMLGFSYPGGPVIEKLAKEVKNIDKYNFPRPMMKHKNLDFSFSGLKTALLYKLRDMSEEEKIENLNFLASSYQEAIMKSLVKKTERAIHQTGIANVIIGGGVSANSYLRKLLRSLVKKNNGSIYFPPLKYLNFDNAAMIAVAGYFRAKEGLFIEDLDKLDRTPRLSLVESSFTSDRIEKHLS